MAARIFAGTVFGDASAQRSMIADKFGTTVGFDLKRQRCGLFLLAISYSIDTDRPPARNESKQNGGVVPQMSKNKTKSKHRSRTKRRIINNRFVLVMLGIVCAVFGGGYLLHKLQVDRNADIFRERAETADEDGQFGPAVRNYNRYLRFRPEDTAVRAKLGQLLEDNASSARHLLQAYLTYEKILLDEENQDDVRQRLVDVALRIGRSADAKSHIERLLLKTPGNAELIYKLGLCAESENHLQQAATLYQQAIETGYQEPAVFQLLANIFLQELDRGEEASTLIDDMVKANPESATALLTRARLRLGRRQIKEALEDLNKAKEFDPESIEIILLESTIALSDTRMSADGFKPVREKLQLAIGRRPEEIMLYERLARIELRAGGLEAAEQILQSGVQAVKSPSILVAMLGDVLISLGKLTEAQEQLDRLQQLNAPGPLIDFFTARLHMENGELREATRLFDGVEPRVTQTPWLQERCRRYLATCYERMGDRDRQIEELENTLEINPQADKTRLKLASVLAAAEKINKALSLYRPLSHLPGVPMAIARLEFRRILRQPPDQRDWSPLEAAIQQVGEGSADAALLQEQILRARGEHEAAWALLKKLCTESPTKEASTRMALVLMEQGKWSDADTVIEETRQTLGDSVSLRTARAAWILETRMEKADQALEKLASDVDAFSENDQFRLFVSLAEFQEMAGNTAAAERLWKLAVEKRPQDRRTWMRLVQMAVAGHEVDAANGYLEELRSIAGPQSPDVWAVEATLLINSRKTRQSELDQARSLVNQIELTRSDWLQVPLLTAKIDELEAKPEDTCQNYLLAIRMGHRDTRDIARAVTQLIRLKRYNDVRQLLSVVQYDPSLANRRLIRRLRAEIALNRGNLNNALQLTGQAVPADSPILKEQIWLGEMLERLGRINEAETAYRAAVELAPKNPASWTGLLQFLNRQNRQEVIDAEIVAAGRYLKQLDDPNDLARIFDAAGKTDEASRYYQQSLEASPPGASTTQQVARFYLRSKQHAKAEPLLRSLIEPDKNYHRAVVLQARRSLARVLATRNYSGFREAIGLLDTNIAEHNVSTTDQLIKAQILAARHHPGLLKDAVQIFEGLGHQNRLPLESRRMLAQLCDALGDTAAADRHWQLLLGPTAGSRHIATYIRRQLNREHFDEIAPLLERLEKLDPSAGLNLTFRWQVANGNGTAGTELLQQFINNPKSTPKPRPARVFRAATLAEQVAGGLEPGSAERSRLFSVAETWYREILDDAPNITLHLARLLGRMGRISEALVLCEPVQQTLKSGFDLTGVAMHIVREPAATAADVARVEQWLQTAVNADISSPVGLTQLAEFGLYHDRYKESSDIYEGLLKKTPDHMIASNNLAWLLSLWKGNHDRAEQLIDKAIQSVGPIASLLDTRGTIHLNRGRYGLAVEDFRDAVSLINSPSHRFHLSVAYWKRGSRRAALLNLRRALNSGFKLEDLLPLEQQVFHSALQEMHDLMESQHPSRQTESRT